MQILPLEHHTDTQFGAQIPRQSQLSLLRNLIHPRCQDHAQVIRISVREEAALWDSLKGGRCGSRVKGVVFRQAFHSGAVERALRRVGDNEAILRGRQIERRGRVRRHCPRNRLAEKSSR